MWNRHRAITAGFISAVVTTGILACSDPTDGENAQDSQHRWPALTSAPAELARDLELIDFPPQQKPPETGGMTAVLKDIISHLPAENSGRHSSPDMATWAHEGTHGVHELIRGRFNRTGRKVAGIYLLNDKAAIMIEPKVPKRRTAEFIPQALHGENHDLYVVGQTIYDDTPLYLLEQLTSRINAAAVSLEGVTAQQITTEEANAGLAGLIEFTAYNIALAMAVQKYDPAYFVEHKQFTALLGIAIERALLLYRWHKAVGATGRSSHEDELYQALTRGVDGNAMRAFTARLYGNAWFGRVFINEQAMQVTRDSASVASALAATLPTEHASQDQDSDGDGVPDRFDRCPDTKKDATGSAKVWTYGDWIGCAEGEQRQ